MYPEVVAGYHLTCLEDVLIGEQVELVVERDISLDMHHHRGQVDGQRRPGGAK